MRNRWLAPAGLAAAALVVAACGSSSSSGGSGNSPAAAPATSAAAAASSTTLESGKVGSATVLTTSKGFTIYWFAPDTPTQSKCNGSCATFWPPVHGPVTAMSGVKGTFGVITRSDGSKQATWNGHPLYTYVSDTKPGEAKGNGLNLSGGVWHEVALSGAAAPAPAKSSSSGGNGYGY